MSATIKLSASQLNSELVAHSRDTGVPAAELKRMCLRAGLDLLSRGELTVRKEPPERLPIFLPRNAVLMMKEVFDAAGVQGTAEDWAEEWLISMLKDSMKRHYGEWPEGIINSIMEDYQIPDKPETAARLVDVVSRWTITNGKIHRREECSPNPK